MISNRLTIEGLTILRLVGGDRVRFLQPSPESVVEKKNNRLLPLYTSIITTVTTTH